MMYWHGNGPHWWMLVLTILFMIPLWVGVAVAAVAVLRLDRRDERTPGEPVRLSPEALLAERFASGDVDETEYLHRLSVLHPNVAKSRPSNPTQPHQ